MIDNLSLALTHGLMLLAAILLLRRPDLDREDGGGANRPMRRKPNAPAADSSDGDGRRA